MFEEADLKTCCKINEKKRNHKTKIHYQISELCIAKFIGKTK